MVERFKVIAIMSNCSKAVIPESDFLPLYSSELSFISKPLSRGGYIGWAGNCTFYFQLQVVGELFFEGIQGILRVLSNMQARKNEKIYRIRDRCTHTSVKDHCTDVLICHCKMGLEILHTSKERSVVVWCFFFFLFFERYRPWESFCHPSYCKTFLCSCCGCEWQLNIMCVEEKKGRNSCSESRLPCA